MTVPQLVLASSSPRRREILERITSAFIIRPADIDETPAAGEAPIDYVVRLAVEKAQAVAVPNSIVIGADTSVILDGDILGKPRNGADAAATLRRLADRSHDVITGVAVVVTDATGAETVHAGHEHSEVVFAPLTDERIAWYVATGEADDKAGSYGLQGAGGLFADHVRGSVSNIIGLPLGQLDELCRRAGIDLLSLGGRA